MNPSNTRGAAPLTGLIAVLVLVAVVVGGVLVSGVGSSGPTVSPSEGDVGGSTAAGRPATRDLGPSEAQRGLAATRALLLFERAVRTERQDLFERSASGGDSSNGDDVFSSLRRLPLATYSMRYIGEVSHRAQTWRADVSVQWQLSRVDRRAITSEVEVTFSGDARQANIVRVSPTADEETPPWLLGRLDVERVGPALVLSLQPPLTEGIVAQTRQAVSDVRHVLGGWDGGLVVVLPETTAQLEGMLASDPHAYDSIAAVTASADGSGDPAAPVRVVLNPPVFTTLGPIAGQVVLSHEATHAATGATFRDMPLWLVEGFGDYVALAREPVPVQVAAGQALRRVRRVGPPRELPDEGDFSTSAHGLGASYEAAWLACRLIANRYGEDGLLRFYQRVSRDGEVGAAFRTVLGTTEGQFTEAWSAYLRRLAT